MLNSQLLVKKTCYFWARLFSGTPLIDDGSSKLILTSYVFLWFCISPQRLNAVSFSLAESSRAWLEDVRRNFEWLRSLTRLYEHCLLIPDDFTTSENNLGGAPSYVSLSTCSPGINYTVINKLFLVKFIIHSGNLALTSQLTVFLTFLGYQLKILNVISQLSVKANPLSRLSFE